MFLGFGSLPDTFSRLPATLFFAVVFAVASSTSGATFTSGVAAGDAGPDSIVLWTRTAEASVLKAQVATDDTFAEVVFTAQLDTSSEQDFTAKVVADGLSPATRYVYRFVDIADGSSSDVGRLRTAPSAETAAPLRIVFSGDSNYQRAPLRLLDFAAEEGGDIFLWFGDTIYGDIPAGDLGIARTLDDYRAKYRQIRTDTALRRLSASTAMVAGWDDHEVANDYDGGDPQGFPPRDRIEAGYRAFFEHMPIAEPGLPDDPYRTYRRIRWGRNVELFLLDGRQYRDADPAEACDHNPDPYGVVLGLFADPACVETLRQPRTMLGAEQLSWLKAGLLDSDATVKFIVSNVPVTFFGVLPDDRWDGYDAERAEILEFIDAHQLENVWILTTDFHLNLFNPDLNSYFRRFRPDVALTNGVRVPEVIVGPIGTDTFEEVAIWSAASVLGVADVPLAQGPLQLLFDSVMGTIVGLNELAFLEANRFAYALVDVSEAGEVTVTFRGIDPDPTSSGHNRIATLYTTEPPPPLCGVLGLLPATLSVLSLGAWRTATRRRRCG